MSNSNFSWFECCGTAFDVSKSLDDLLILGKVFEPFGQVWNVLLSEAGIEKNLECLLETGSEVNVGKGHGVSSDPLFTFKL